MNDLRILLVDDDEDDFLLTSDYLQEIPGKNFYIEWARSFNEALEKIRTRSHDIYIFDFLLGARTGLDLLQQAVSLGCEEPIILLTGKGDRKIDAEATRLGASDYLVKGELDAEKLERSIRYALEQTAMLKALRESEIRYRTVFEHSKDMIYITNTDADFISINDSATELLGYSREEFFSMKAWQLYENTGYQEIFEKKMKEEGEFNDFEAVLVAKNGEKKYCIISANVQTDRRSQPYYQGVVHDITARKRTERVSLLTEKMAATNRLVRTLAHEVRNPLTNINLSVENLESEPIDETLEAYIGIIKRNSKRINDLITELLNSSRPTEIRLNRHPIARILEETLSEAQDRINLKNIRLVKDFESDCSIVAVDENKIKIAFLNLIINAIEAMDENTGVLTVSTHALPGKCLVSIRDNGSGISTENIGKLFEPYFTSKATGMGLGLAATLNIVQSHSATIEVESEPGKGTVFTITFNLD